MMNNVLVFILLVESCEIRFEPMMLTVHCGRCNAQQFMCRLSSLVVVVGAARGAGDACVGCEVSLLHHGHCFGASRRNYTSLLHRLCVV